MRLLSITRDLVKKITLHRWFWWPTLAKAWRTRALLETAGARNGGAEERAIARVEISNVFLTVSDWEVESVERASAKRASYADTRISFASVSAMHSFY